jgi:outer membrane lipoprotein-sorting protein
VLASSLAESGGDVMKKIMSLLLVGALIAVFVGGCQPAQQEGTTDAATTETPATDE